MHRFSADAGFVHPRKPKHYAFYDKYYGRIQKINHRRNLKAKVEGQILSSTPRSRSYPQLPRRCGSVGDARICASLLRALCAGHGSCCILRTRCISDVPSMHHGGPPGWRWRGSQGCDALICMPESAPKIKVDAVRRLGGAIHLHGESYTEAQTYAHVPPPPPPPALPLWRTLPRPFSPPSCAPPIHVSFPHPAPFPFLLLELPNPRLKSCEPVLPPAPHAGAEVHVQSEGRSCRCCRVLSPLYQSAEHRSSFWRSHGQVSHCGDVYLELQIRWLAVRAGVGVQARAKTDGRLFISAYDDPYTIAGCAFVQLHGPQQLHLT